MLVAFSNKLPMTMISCISYLLFKYIFFVWNHVFIEIIQRWCYRLSSERIRKSLRPVATRTTPRTATPPSSSQTRTRAATSSIKAEFLNELTTFSSFMSLWYSEPWKSIQQTNYRKWANLTFIKSLNDFHWRMRSLRKV